MAIELISKIKPKNGGTFPMGDAEDVEMPDGSRLSEFDPSGLPEVTEADEGKFLQVANGVWVAVDAVPQLQALMDAYIEEKFPSVTQTEYDALVEAGTMDGTKYYMIVGDSA